MRIACLGCGSIGDRHVMNLRGIGVRNVIVYDPDPVRAEGVARKHGAIRAGSEQEAIEGADIILICSPPHLHKDQIISVAAATPTLFIEKPLVASKEDVQALADAVIPDARTLVACNFRFHEPMTRLKAMISSGELGKIYSLRARFGQYLPDWRPTTDYRKGYSASRALGGGVVLDRIHELDYALWLLGDVAESVALTGKLSDLAIATEDIAEITLRFTNGALGNIHVDYLRPIYDCSCEILGEHGFAIWTFQDHALDWFDRRSGQRHKETWPATNLNSMYIAQMQHLLDLAQQRVASMNTLSEALTVTRLALTLRDGTS